MAEASSDATAASDSMGDGSLDAGDASDAPFVVDGCVSNKAPKDDACVLQDAIGVFVSSSGSDNAPGTSASPVATIAKALSIARLEGKPSIFVCGGNYAAKIELSPGPGIAVYGGLACGGSATDAGPDGSAADAAADAAVDASIGGAWSYTGELTRFAPPGEGVVLLVDQVSTLTVLADLEIVAADATDLGTSSIAGFVRNCPAIDLQRVTLIAGHGADGRPGDAGAFANDVPKTGTNAGGGAVTCTCAGGGTSVGGNGGAGGIVPGAGGSGTPNLGGAPPKDGAGGAAGCVAGRDGADARHGDGGSATTQNGSLTSTGFVAPNAGGNGAIGGVAQGGGGGGGTTLGGAGGGGGCGGCGGEGGFAGTSGGGSFALLVHQSNLRVSACRLVAGAGGNGGAGGRGETAQDGGAPGTGACGGGNGGQGGHGGGGSGGRGGRGGHSIAIAYSGQAPIVTGTILETADAGTGGDGGNAATPSSAGQSGVAGIRADTLPLTP